MTETRAAVIGSGFGGLAAAIRLQAAGLRTVVLEKRDLPGGRAYVYHDQGFTFDAGPTVITAPECLRELFTNAGTTMENYVELMPVTPFYRLFWEDGYRFDYSGDLASIVAQIGSTSARDPSPSMRSSSFATSNASSSGASSSRWHRGGTTITSEHSR